ncbi:MAG TPA: hypothetical protein VLA54_11055 [Acidimicrobiia bacterium]|nr:hypothetical protein [Acidimicrobiia bacterium]
MRRHLTLVLAATMVIGVAGTAIAATTIFVSGYDPENRMLLWGASDPEVAAYDCTVEDGTYEYVADQSGHVTSLEKGGNPVVFEDTENTSTTVAYGQTDGDCDLSAVDVTGPNGQVNHGQIVSSLVHALKSAGYRGSGCMVSRVAQTDWGKGDQQVTASTASTTTTTVATVEGDVDLTTAEVTCGKHKDTGGEDGELTSSQGDGPGNGHGRPSWAGQGNRGKNR